MLCCGTSTHEFLAINATTNVNERTMRTVPQISTESSNCVDRIDSNLSGLQYAVVPMDAVVVSSVAPEKRESPRSSMVAQPKSMIFTVSAPFFLEQSRMFSGLKNNEVGSVGKIKQGMISHGNTQNRKRDLLLSCTASFSFNVCKKKATA